MIREATPADEPALRRLQSELREYDPAFLSYAIAGPPLVLLADPIDGYAIALSDVDPIGAGEVDERPGELEGADASGDANDVVAAYLAELVVAPSRRRQGIGSAILEATIDRLAGSGADALRAVVHPENEPALSFYRDRGFEEVSRLPDFYADGPGVVVWRRLPRG